MEAAARKQPPEIVDVESDTSLHSCTELETIGIRDQIRYDSTRSRCVIRHARIPLCSPEAR